MKLKSSVICGLIGSSVLLIVQLFYFILNSYVEYVEDGYSIYDSIPKPVFTVLGIAIVLAWLLIVCFFVGLLKKTR
jgi:tryptophan-rich sensory protein